MASLKWHTVSEHGSRSRPLRSATSEHSQHALFACSRSLTASQLTRLHLLSCWHSAFFAGQQQPLRPGAGVSNKEAQDLNDIFAFNLRDREQRSSAAARSPACRTEGFVRMTGSNAQRTLAATPCSHWSSQELGWTLYHRGPYGRSLCARLQLCMLHNEQVLSHVRAWDPEALTFVSTVRSVSVRTRLKLF